ncbi:aminobenzoate oxygenase, partial [Mycobacterium sp. ITM-2017-0098]
MTASPAATTSGREDFAVRLLKGSAKKSYEPIVDIDWDAPLPDDKFFLPPQMLSLYGTPL